MAERANVVIGLFVIKLSIHHTMVLSGAQRNSAIFISSKKVLHTPVILLPIIMIVSGHMMILFNRWAIPRNFNKNSGYF